MWIMAILLNRTGLEAFLTCKVLVENQVKKNIVYKNREHVFFSNCENRECSTGRLVLFMRPRNDGLS